MDQYVTLVGTEQMQSAANTMHESVRNFGTAVSDNAHYLQRHRQWADEWLNGFREVVERFEKAVETWRTQETR